MADCPNDSQQNRKPTANICVDYWKSNLRSGGGMPGTLYPSAKPCGGFSGHTNVNVRV
jgi:hypothetical protein